jgi:hypothetical protein
MIWRMFRPLLVIAVLLSVGVGGAIAADNQVYLFGILPTGKDAPAAVLNLVSAKATIHTCYEVRKGFLGLKKCQAMIIGTAPANREEFIKTGLFKDLPENIRIRTTWTRASVIYGSSYKLRPRWVNYEFPLKAEDMADAFALTNRLLRDNLAELKEIAHEKYLWLTVQPPVVHGEIGYYIEFNLAIEGLSLAEGGKWIPLFETQIRSEYFR